MAALAVLVRASCGSSGLGKSICLSPPGGVGLGVGVGRGVGLGPGVGVGVGVGCGGLGNGVGVGSGVGLGVGKGVELAVRVGCVVSSARTKYQSFGLGVAGVLSPRWVLYLKVPAST